MWNRKLYQLTFWNPTLRSICLSCTLNESRSDSLVSFFFEEISARFSNLPETRLLGTGPHVCPLFFWEEGTSRWQLAQPHSHSLGTGLSPVCGGLVCISRSITPHSRSRLTRASFDTMSTFYCFIEGILKWGWLFFFFFTGSEAAKNTVINTAPMGVTARSTPKHGVSPSAACAPPVGKLKGKRKWLSVQQCPHLQGVRSKTTVDAWNCR